MNKVENITLSGMMGVAFLFSQNLKLKLKEHVHVGRAELLEDVGVSAAFQDLFLTDSPPPPRLVHRLEGPRLAPLADGLWALHLLAQSLGLQLGEGELPSAKTMGCS